MQALSSDFFARPTLEVAPELLGCLIMYRSCLVKVTEVEAYSNDEASHGYRRTARSAIMHDSFGHVYVYRSYGVHLCMNFTTDRRHSGAVLIRSAEPLEGLSAMRQRRGDVKAQMLCRGPGNLTLALGITIDLNESLIGDKVIVLAGKPTKIAASVRVGISKAKDLPWRFFDPESTSVSGSTALNRSARLLS